MSKEEAARVDSTTRALEGTGLEDTCWSVFFFIVAPGSALKDLIFPFRDWLNVAMNLYSIPKLIKSGVKSIDKKEYDKIARLLRRGAITINDLIDCLGEARIIYNFLKSSDDPAPTDSYCYPDVLRANINVKVFPSISARVNSDSLKFNAKLLHDIERRIKEFEEFLEFLQKQPIIGEPTFNPRLDQKFEIIPEDTEHIIPVEPEDEENNEELLVEPEILPSIVASMLNCRRLIEQGAASLFGAFAERSAESGAQVSGMFDNLGERTVESMESRPEALGQLSLIAGKAFASLGAMSGPAALAASASLAVCARGLGRGSKRSVPSEERFPSGATQGGPVPTGRTSHEVNVYVDGHRVSGPRELKALLAAGGVEPALGRAFIGLM